MAKEKAITVQRLLDRFAAITRKSLQRKDYETALSAIRCSAHTQYAFNQRYTDVFLEEKLKQIAAEMKPAYQQQLSQIEADNNTVLFYDGFGLDTRGVAGMYLRSLKNNGYHIVYVTRKTSENSLPTLLGILEGTDAVCEFVDMESRYRQRIDALIQVFIRHRPKAMLFYTLPDDVAGCVAFHLYEGIGKRYLIDLTDHAFWLGTGCNDYFFGSREMSASNQLFGRGIPKEKLIKLGVNLLVDPQRQPDPFPFDVENSRYIFSGGALYKTLGDKENTYYRIVDHILQKHKDVKFLYAGTGDESQMQLLLDKYPQQAFLIPERKDFYYLISHSVFYLNTYPMFGGMMMKYSAHAKKIPVTLRHKTDSDGLLIDQAAAKIDYDSYEALVEDVDRLLTDEAYLRSREALLEGKTITQQRFDNNLHSAIETQTTDYDHAYEKQDTTEFLAEYYRRFRIADVYNYLCYRQNFPVLLRIPSTWPYIFKKILRKICRINAEG